MIGQLPTTFLINGTTYPIRTDFRIALIIMQASNDPRLNDQAKAYIVLDALIGTDKLKKEDVQEAYQKCIWFLDGGRIFEQQKRNKKLMDWEQDEQLIFSAVNDVARTETRLQPYIHWWTFLGYFNEIKEGLFSSVIMIRQKKAKGKKLDKSEREFYRQNRELIDLKQKYTPDEQKQIEELEKIFF